MGSDDETVRELYERHAKLAEDRGDTDYARYCHRIAEGLRENETAD